MLNYEETPQLYSLLNEYQTGKIELYELLEGSVQYFASIRGVCAWLTCDGKNNFDGYHFDDLMDYYKSIL